jgi:hypothetical protein
LSGAAGGGEAPGALHFDLDYDEPTLRRIVRGHVRHRMGPGYLVGLALMATALFFELRAGDRSWIIGALGVVIAMGLLVPVLAWRSQLAYSLGALRRLDPPRIHVVAGDTLRFESSAGTMVLRWSDLTRVLVLRDAWILSAGERQVTVPLAGLDEATREAFAARLRGAGLRF